MPSTNRNAWFTPCVRMVKWATIYYKNHAILWKCGGMSESRSKKTTLKPVPCRFFLRFTLYVSILRQKCTPRTKFGWRAKLLYLFKKKQKKTNPDILDWSMIKSSDMNPIFLNGQIRHPDLNSLQYNMYNLYKIPVSFWRVLISGVSY